MKLSDFYWPATFFSTAFGAGIFFLPQSVGPAVLGMSYFGLFIIISMLLSLAAHYLFYAFISSTDERDFFVSSARFIGRKFSSIIFLFFIVAIALINFISLINALIMPFGSSLFIRCCASLSVSIILSFTWFKYNGSIEVFISKMAVIAIFMVLVVSVFFFFSNEREGVYYNHVSIVGMLSVFPVFLFTFNFTPCIQRFAKSADKPKIINIFWGKVIVMFLFSSWLFLLVVG